MRFDLYRLGAREFENLTQAIAVAELGPDVAVYGMGSDGGREATRHEPESVNYTVLQAKYKETPTAAQAEATWLIKELRKEFSDWRTSEKRETKPAIFIVATNVTLSATPRTGGMDRVAKVMKEECGKLGISQWVVWHSENINRFLEKHPGIRTSYAAWVLPGDILAAIYEDVSKRNSDTARAIRSYVSKELLNDRYANLDQAGSADDRTVPLADVFFDVPIAPSHDRSATTRQLRCLKTLITVCDMRHSSADAAATTIGDTSEAINRFVLVGGPGQGKSTVSQFLCQLYRAQLVKDTTSMRNAEVRAAVSQINTQATKESLLPKARRWPINIQLTRLADELAQGKCRNLLDYIAQRVSDATGVDISPSDMRDWLSTFPWLLVLDGLDEVPGSSNRDEVLSHISAFQLEADELNADLVIVATTRPQGYTDEFSPKNYAHYYLTALDTASALAYGRKLANARHGNSSDRVQRLMERLERAAAEPSTAHLMATPLQVTIMAVLLDRVGKAPKDRFTLFADYYRVIFERELEKEGAASNLLRDHKTDIDSIHADVGLLLQTRSERSGETESRITVDELDTIIRDRLAGEGHDGRELEQLTSAISRAATHRLVFLVPSRDAEVSFEIRSLQEFWAADALMNCSEEEIGRRLRVMAVSSHWRNVLLFALGNIFATRRNNLRDSVVALVSELNSYSEEFGNIPRRILTGSRLAVEILNDGMVRAPRYEAVLIEQSLKLLALPHSEHVSLLAASVSDRGMEIVQDYICTNVESSSSESIQAFLATRAAHHDTWAFNQLLSLHDAADSARKLEMLGTAISYELPCLVHIALRSIVEPELTLPLLQDCEMLAASNFTSLVDPAGCSSAPSWFTPLLSLFNRRHRMAASPTFRAGSFRGTVVGVRDCPPGLSEALEEGFPSDHWIARVVDFSAEPSKSSLANLIKSLGPYALGYEKVASRLPWIIFYAVALYERHGVAAVEMIDGGRLGDVSDWESMEEHWDHQFAAPDSFIDDIDAWFSEGQRFLPIAPCRLTYRKHVGTADSVAEIVSLINAAEDARSKSRLADYFLRVSEPIAPDVPVESMRQLYAAAAHADDRYSAFGWVSDSCTSEEWLSLLDEMGRDVTIGLAWIPWQFPALIVDHWLGDITRIGLGRIMACRSTQANTSPQSLRKIHTEWERLQTDSQADKGVKEIVCLLASLYFPPRDQEDATARLTCLESALRSGELMSLYMARNLMLDVEPPSRSMILKLADLPTLSPFERQGWYARMVRLQASAPTGIEYRTMRPC
ncbi:NACHT domain-containing protein [Streptomyces rochei]|jgi:hypothetical protein|uniref:NACHT domain-containing protein n=1 Tax=Streptomyces rochei TaxID=1928 RepID=UPI0036E028A3